MGVRSWEEPLEGPPRVVGPPLLGAAAVALGLLVLLLSNGRPIGSGDARPTERMATAVYPAATRETMDSSASPGL